MSKVTIESLVYHVAGKAYESRLVYTHGASQQPGLVMAPNWMGISEGADDEVLEAVDVLRIDDALVHGEVRDLAGATHGDGDESAAGLADNAGLDDLFLSLLQLCLHLLSLLDDLVHIGLSHFVSFCCF